MQVGNRRIAAAIQQIIQAKPASRVGLIQTSDTTGDFDAGP
jgi:hypothetical protein